MHESQIEPFRIFILLHRAVEIFSNILDWYLKYFKESKMPANIQHVYSFWHAEFLYYICVQIIQFLLLQTSLELKYFKCYRIYSVLYENSTSTMESLQNKVLGPRFTGYRDFTVPVGLGDAI